MSKLKTLKKISVKIKNKLLHGDLKHAYTGMTYSQLLKKTAISLGKSGPLNTSIKIKKKLHALANSTGGLVFPNGINMSVTESQCVAWFKDNFINKKNVAIVIPSYNDFEVLSECIESLKKTTPSLIKIYIVDDYCEAKNLKRLKSLEDGQIKVIPRTKNGGFAKAVNTGIETVSEKSDVILLNSDIIAHENWLESLCYGAYGYAENVGIVGPMLLYPDGRIQSAGSHRNTESTEFFDHYYRFKDKNYGPANIPYKCMGVTGAVMYIKRSTLEKIGGIDTNFPFAFEDMDFCLRAWEKGLSSLYFPVSKLTHIESATRKKNDTISDKEQRSIKYFWSKWDTFFNKRNVLTKDGKIKIIFVLQSWGMSGGIKQVFEHAEKISKEQFYVEIWSLSKEKPSFAHSKDVALRSFKDYGHLIKNLSPIEAIKVSTWWETAYPVWQASVINGIPVYFIQEMETWFYPDDPRSQSAVIASYRKELINLTESEYNLSEIKQIGLNAKLINAGYDGNVYKKLKKTGSNDFKVLAAGRSFFQKNLKLTTDGWKLLGESKPPLTLFGSEPELKKIDPKKINYILRPSDIELNKLYNSHSVFIQTSIHEGFCLPIIEAMAAGCAVICTDSHGNRGFSINGKTCLVVPQNDPEEVANSITKLSVDEDLRMKLVRNGLKMAKKFEWESIIPQVETFYKEVANNRRPL